jgi:hypothetical protein
LSVNNSTGQTALQIATGWLVVGAPTGPAMMPDVGNVNISGSYSVNGVSIGTPPFLPLTGPAATRTGPLTINTTGLADQLTLTSTGGTAGMTLGNFASGAMVEWAGTSMTFTVMPTFAQILSISAVGIQTGATTGPAVTGSGNINMAGDLFKNGVNVFAPLNLPVYNNLLPQPGDLWFDGTNLNFRNSTTTVVIA